jgi:Tfp pilus assembly protein PilF
MRNKSYIIRTLGILVAQFILMSNINLSALAPHSQMSQNILSQGIQLMIEEQDNSAQKEKIRKEAREKKLDATRLDKLDRYALDSNQQKNLDETLIFDETLLEKKNFTQKVLTFAINLAPSIILIIILINLFSGIFPILFIISFCALAWPFNVTINSIFTKAMPSKPEDPIINKIKPLFLSNLTWIVLITGCLFSSIAFIQLPIFALLAIFYIFKLYKVISSKKIFDTKGKQLNKLTILGKEFQVSAPVLFIASATFIPLIFLGFFNPVGSIFMIVMLLNLQRALMKDNESRKTFILISSLLTGIFLIGTLMIFFLITPAVTPLVILPLFLFAAYIFKIFFFSDNIRTFRIKNIINNLAEDEKLLNIFNEKKDDFNRKTRGEIINRLISQYNEIVTEDTIIIERFKNLGIDIKDSKNLLELSFEELILLSCSIEHPFFMPNIQKQMLTKALEEKKFNSKKITMVSLGILVGAILIFCGIHFNILLGLILGIIFIWSILIYISNFFIQKTHGKIWILPKAILKLLLILNTITLSLIFIPIIISLIAITHETGHFLGSAAQGAYIFVKIPFIENFSNGFSFEIPFLNYEVEFTGADTTTEEADIYFSLREDGSPVSEEDVADEWLETYDINNIAETEGIPDYNEDGVIDYYDKRVFIAYNYDRLSYNWKLETGETLQPYSYWRDETFTNLIEPVYITEDGRILSSNEYRIIQAREIMINNSSSSIFSIGGLCVHLEPTSDEEIQNLEFTQEFFEKLGIDEQQQRTIRTYSGSMTEITTVAAITAYSLKKKQEKTAKKIGKFIPSTFKVWTFIAEIGTSFILNTFLYIFSGRGDWAILSAFSAIPLMLIALLLVIITTLVIKVFIDNNFEIEENAKKYIAKGSNYKIQKKYDLAIIAYTNAIEIEPSNSEYYALRAQLYQKQELYDLAIADFNMAIEINPSNSAFYALRAKLYLKQKLYDLANAGFNMAIEIDPSNSVYYALRAQLYQKQKLYDLAKADFNMAIEIDSSNSVYYILRAKLYQEQKLYDLAKADLVMVIELDQNSEKIKEAQLILRDIQKLEAEMPESPIIAPAVQVPAKHTTHTLLTGLKQTSPPDGIPTTPLTEEQIEALRDHCDVSISRQLSDLLPTLNFDSQITEIIFIKSDHADFGQNGITEENKRFISFSNQLFFAFEQIQQNLTDPKIIANNTEMFNRYLLPLIADIEFAQNILKTSHPIYSKILQIQRKYNCANTSELYEQMTQATEGTDKKAELKEAWTLLLELESNTFGQAVVNMLARINKFPDAQEKFESLITLLDSFSIYCETSQIQTYTQLIKTLRNIWNARNQIFTQDIPNVLTQGLENTVFKAAQIDQTQFKALAQAA